MKKEIAVKFNTITPLWTGDAWRENCEIRPSSLIGSLRFWFEVICYFSGICKRKHFSPKLGRFEKEVNRKDFRNCLSNEGNSFEAKIKCLLEEDIPWPSIVFGTTNWKSLISIKEIEYLDDYSFGNKLNLPYAIGIKKDNPENIEEFQNKEDWKNKINSYGGGNFKEKLKKAKKEFSFFFFNNPYFYGNFQVKFEVEEEIIEPIFYPLLTFMKEYGFWGGKWNIGYGRLEILKIKENDNPIHNWEKEIFLFSKINGKIGDKSFECFVRNNVSDFNTLKQKNRKIQLFISYYSKNSFINVIKELIGTKAKERVKFRINTEERHKIFGKTGSPRSLSYVPQGSKILPFINKTERNEFSYDCGFLSITGLLNLEGENNG